MLVTKEKQKVFCSRFLDRHKVLLYRGIAHPEQNLFVNVEILDSSETLKLGNTQVHNRMRKCISLHQIL